MTPLKISAATTVMLSKSPLISHVNTSAQAASISPRLVTAINLFPIGQFDGGHIAYAVLGRRSFSVSLATVGAAIALCFYSLSWVTWTLLALVILTIFGWRHPPTWDEHVPLDRVRFWLALATLAVFVLCFTPAPIEPLELVRPR